jgi:hypothetical protein
MCEGVAIWGKQKHKAPPSIKGTRRRIKLLPENPEMRKMQGSATVNKQRKRPVILVFFL